MQKYFDINEEACSIRCVLHCADAHDIRRVVVYCHGFGSHKDTKSAEKFATRAVAKSRGTAVVAFDWPCHGSDARKNLVLDECLTYLDVVVRYVARRFQVDELYACGSSFGAYMILNYLLRYGNPFRRIAFRCPAVGMHRSLAEAIMTDGDLDALAAGKPVLAGFERKVKISAKFLDDLKANDVMNREFFDFADDILIVHGTADSIVPFELVQAFADNNVIQLVPVEGADHQFRDPKKMDLAISRIIEFFEL